MTEKRTPEELAEIKEAIFNEDRKTLLNLNVIKEPKKGRPNNFEIKELADGIYIIGDEYCKSVMSNGYSNIDYYYYACLTIYDLKQDEVLWDNNDFYCGANHNRCLEIEDGKIRFFGTPVKLPKEVQAILQLQPTKEKIEEITESLKNGNEERKQRASELQDIRERYQSDDVKSVIPNEKTRVALQRVAKDNLPKKDLDKSDRKQQRQELCGLKKELSKSEGVEKVRKLKIEKKENAEQREGLLSRLKRLRQEFDSPEMKSTLPDEKTRLKLRGVMHKKMKQPE